MQKRQFIVLIGLLMSYIASAGNPHVDIQTNLGTIVVELKPNDAPLTVANFQSYIGAGFYDNTLFHRVVEDFVIQGGGYTQDMSLKATNDPIALESDNGLKNTRGSIAMARTSVPDSATSQFYINTVDNVNLDFLFNNNDGYAVFGQVVEGMNVVDEISAVEKIGHTPVKQVVIQTVRDRATTLQFKGLRSSYAPGDEINVTLEEVAISRDKPLDLWVAIQLPDGRFLFISTESDAESLSFQETPFQRSVTVDKTNHLVFSYKVPPGLAGRYRFYAIYNQSGADIKDLLHSLRSNIVFQDTELTH